MGQIDQEAQKKFDAAIWRNYSEGAIYAMYVISEQLHVESDDIRLSNACVHDKAVRLAQRIQESLSPTP